VTIGEALRRTREILAESPAIQGRGTADAEAERIISHVLARRGSEPSRLELYSGSSRPIEDALGERAFSIARDRAAGRPLQHLTGTQVFLDHEYEVGPEVLVPRPETELLVIRAMEYLRAHGDAPVLGLEVGLGSGAISIELLARYPGLRILATEPEPGARAVASRNAARILGSRGAGRLTVIDPESADAVCAPLHAALGGAKAAFLVSNPPYLSEDDPIDRDVVAHEPRAALFPASGDALHFYRDIARGAGDLLLSRAPVFLELAHQRAREVLRLFEAEGWDAVVLPDLNGTERVLEARKGGKRG
jgi:release factor glutamine methyltransferase